MIQFGAANLFVEDANGNTQSFDLEALRERLSNAFQLQGIRENWLPENLVLTLEEKIRSGNEAGVRLTEADLEQILLNVLIATGYREVATAYLRLNHREVVLLPEGMRSWDLDTVQQMLSSSLPLSICQIGEISRDSLKALEKLGFAEVSETFLRELAVHLLHFRKSPGPEKLHPPSARRTQFIPAQAWLELATDRAAELIEQQILLPLPLSDIFPAARLEFHLSAFAAWQGGWSPELNLLPAIPEICSEILQLLQRMREYIIRNWPRISNPSAHLIMPGFQHFFLKEIPNLKKKPRLALLEQMKQEFEQQILPQTGFELLLSFR